MYFLVGFPKYLRLQKAKCNILLSKHSFRYGESVYQHAMSQDIFRKKYLRVSRPGQNLKNMKNHDFCDLGVVFGHFWWKIGRGLCAAAQCFSIPKWLVETGYQKTWF